ncbi:MAG: hypothetical protein WA906_01375 [Pacificimonas sp.]
MFMVLIAFGQETFQGLDGSNVQLALFASFTFGIIVGWKTNR